MDYKSAKDINEKEKVIQAIKDDDIFERTKEIIYFQKNKEVHRRDSKRKASIKSMKRSTADPGKSDSSDSSKKDNKMKKENKKDDVIKGFDSRLKDEIDELKMIFYQFFVNPN